MDKPTWDNAPDWAEYLAMDGNGQWWWYESEPIAGYRSWLEVGGRCEPVALIAANWRETLEQRPGNKD